MLTKMLCRWLSLLSGTLVTTAGTCFGEVSWLAGDDTGTTYKALRYNFLIILGFVALGAIFYEYKSKLSKAADDEEKEPLTDMKPSEMLELFVNEGITNLSAAMAAILAQVNYQFLPATHGPMYMFWIFVFGVAILIIGEFVQRSLTKGSMAEYIVNMLNGLNVGSVSWWFGLAMANSTQNLFGAPDGSNSKVTYWMWLVALVFAVLLAQLFNVMSHQVGKGKDDKAYGHVVFSMLKGTPMYSSGWVLNDVVQDRFEGHYLWGTFLWITIGTFVMIQVEHIVHAPSGKVITGSCWADSEKDIFVFANQMSSLLQQTFSFVAGQLAQFALEDWFPVNDFGWFVLGILFQLVGFLVENLRHYYMKDVFKDLSKASNRLLQSF